MFRHNLLRVVWTIPPCSSRPLGCLSIYLRTAVNVELNPPSQGPRNVDVKEDVEFKTKAPSALVPHFSPRTNDLAITSAKYGAVWVWSFG